MCNPTVKRSSSDDDALSRWLARAVLLGFLVATLLLARVNQNPGSSDSCANLILARSLVTGKGYVTGGVGQLWVHRPLDAEDIVRPPGLPYLIAALFALGRVSLQVPVLLNCATVVATALMLRSVIRRRGDRRAGDLALILILVSYTYEMVSIVNNNLLTACTVGLLYVGGLRESAWTTRIVMLAVISALGFLLKPTFLLCAWPFAFLVLGTDVARRLPARISAITGYFALFLLLTSVYWGRNLLLYGDPLYSPPFGSVRLGERYGFLPLGSFRTVRFGRPASYSEVVQTLGLGRLLLRDVKEVAKTLFYTICLNPAVALCAGTGVLFWKREGWRDLAEPAVLIPGILFEVGVYNHHEFRYLWPIYPCLLLLAWTSYRGFADWGTTQMTAVLAQRFRSAFALLAAGALMIGALGGIDLWARAYAEARREPPAWIKVVHALPESSVVLTNDVGAVLWWAERRAVICPLGTRDDLATVIAAYRADHYLGVGDGALGERGVAFTKGDLEPLARGPGWALFRIVGPLREGSISPPESERGAVNSEAGHSRHLGRNS